jgi:hypothetical protein
MDVQREIGNGTADAKRREAAYGAGYRDGLIFAGLVLLTWYFGGEDGAQRLIAIAPFACFIAACVLAFLGQWTMALLVAGGGACIVGFQISFLWTGIVVGVCWIASHLWCKYGSAAS